MNISIDIVSDIACPWCFIGKKRLEKALQELPEINADVRWHPFQLDPTIPAEGLDKNDYYAKRFGGKERVQQIAQQFKAVGQAEGIAFDIEGMPKAINTLPLHQLLFQAGQDGTQNDLKEHLFKAYFEKGVDFTDRDQIVSVMTDFGWSAEKTKEVLDSKEIAEAVKQEINHAQSLGVTGVPFFIINNSYGLSGAQSPEVFVEVLQKIAAEQELAAVAGDACNIDGSNC